MSYYFDPFYYFLLASSPRPMGPVHQTFYNPPNPPAGEEKFVPKKKRLCLSIADKARIVERMNQGESDEKIVCDTGASKNTISTIRKTKEEILLRFNIKKTTSKIAKLTRRNVEPKVHPLLEDRVYQWYVQARQQGLTISQKDVEKQAVKLNWTLGEPSYFKCPVKWLIAFQRRYGICFDSPSDGGKVQQDPYIFTDE